MNRKWLYLLVIILLSSIMCNGGSPNVSTLLPVVDSMITSELEDIEQYGSFYIDRKNGAKFVIALAKQDEKTDRLQAKLKQNLPSHEFMIRTDYKYTVAELKQVNNDLWKKWADLQKSGTELLNSSVDVISDKVVVQAKFMSDETKNSLINEYGADKIEITVDPTFQRAVTQ